MAEACGDSVRSAGAAVERARTQYKRNGRRGLSIFLEAHMRLHAAHIQSRPPSRWSWEK